MPYNVIISMEKGKPVVKFCPTEVEVFIFDLNSTDLYLLDDELICEVSRVDEETGLLTVVVVDDEDGKLNNHRIRDVDPNRLDFYSSSDNDDLLDDFEVDEP
jgi:hypothetical protein